MPKLRLDDDSYLFFSQLEALPESTDLTKCHHCDAPNLEPMPAINLIRALHGIYMIKELTVLRLLTLFSGYTLETLEVCRWLNGLRTFYDEDYTVKFGGLLCNAWCDHWSSTFTNSINISAAAAVLRWSNTYILPENKPPSMSKSMELQQSHEDGIVLRDADVPLNERSIAYQTSTTNLLEYSVYSKTTDCWSKLPKYDGCLARNGEHCGFHSVEY
ncbi:hypothetical protein FOL47_001517 [Perkinsus chesapeaki]|uniref:Uncharacterized protein n=1 Tax=Perkinsus chesapeaki TaxID=330153 RepID=A0A7J6KTS0_PERCH|nr:hypothetical protein FOL47_001517 [Perkinsus chesapeaki]